MEWPSRRYVPYGRRLDSSSLMARLPGQLIGQIIFGVICDTLGRNISLRASSLTALVGAMLHTAARSLQGNSSASFLFISMARGIVGVVS